MKTFTKSCDQGELYFVKLPNNTKIPKNAIRVAPENGRLIIGHSETGHHHVMTAERCELYTLPDDIMRCLLVVNDPDAIEHLRDYDKHESIAFEPGIYSVINLREYAPEGWRRQID